MRERRELSGGRRGAIFKERDGVVRPARPWTSTVHRFLDYMVSNGADFVPRPVAVTDDTEIVSYLPGEVHHYPLPGELYAIEAVRSAARLLRAFHDRSRGFLPLLTAGDVWMLEPREPIEVMCHGDYAPYNVTTDRWRARGIIDFDTLHPGPRMWDLSYAVYRWASFTAPENPDSRFSLSEQIRRGTVFFDTHGVPVGERTTFVSSVVDRLKALVRFMRARADAGEMNFRRNIEDGHMDVYMRDIDYIQSREEAIIDGMCREMPERA
ncbi:MAG: aminoglycoside phosphotransferase family protein [Spirochaetales bacterium]|nr:aminoglycoside phosphotransferase family protein [Spirochaetales bacterium]